MATSVSRSIARDAVRRTMEKTTLDVVLERGFDAVTVTELAEAAGVSRSTFLRHVGTKEDAVLGALAAVGTQLADEVRARPIAEDPWTSLRRAMDVIALSPLRGSERAFTVVALIHTDSGLTRARWQPLLSWRAAIGAVLRERDASLSPVAAEALASAALSCLDTATAHWVATTREDDLPTVLDQAFHAVKPLP